MDTPTFAQSEARRQIDEEIEKRIRIHKANMARLSSSRESAHTLGATVKNEPLVLLAQGDSWFDYPLIGNGPLLGNTDVIAQLRHLGDNPSVILNLAHHGEAAIEAMSLPKQERIIKAIRDKGNWINGRPDAILFSAGGNDIAGDQFCIFLDFNDGKGSGLNEDRFKKALGLVEACYLDLFLLRDRLVPGVPIFGHCYDFPIPNGVHPFCSGPWLRPSLDYCNWTVSDGKTIVHDALSEFRNMLKALADEPANNFRLVETQGVLQADEWANELHPSPEGFKKIAQKFVSALASIRTLDIPNV